MRSSCLALTVALLILAFVPARGQKNFREIDHFLDLLNAEYSGETAHRTTEYVSERWRLPGNAGFDSSIYYVERILQRAGFEASDEPAPDRMTYRI